jgi:hypothetical protein
VISFGIRVVADVISLEEVKLGHTQPYNRENAM